MGKRYLGLEIGNHAVSGVVINSGIQGSAVEACSRAALEGPQDLGPNLSGALERLATEMDLTGTICSVSLPPGSVSYRTIQLPFSDRKKIQQVLPYEIEPQLPYPVEDLVIDYYIMSPHRSDHSDLIAASVQKTSLETLLAVLTPLGIDPVTITSAGFTTALCLAETDVQPADWILADSDGIDLSLFFVEAGNLKLTRATRLPASNKERPAADIFRQIHRSLLAYQDTASPDFAPEAVFTNLTDLLESNHQPADPMLAGLPLKKVDLADRLSPREIETAGHLSAPGLDDNALALGYLETSGFKGLNFRRGPFEKKKQWREHRKHIIGSGALALLLLILFFTNILIDAYYLDKQAERLDRETTAVFKTALPDVKRIVDPLQQMRIKLAKTKQQLTFPLETGRRARIIDLLKTISTRIPNQTDVEMTRVVIGQDNILISGNTDTFNTVDDIKTRLEKAEAFQKVVISSANLEKSGNRVNFKLKVQL